MQRKENIAVAVRCRPAASDSADGAAWALDTTSGRIRVSSSAAGLPHMHKFATEFGISGAGDHAARFDRVFDSQASTRQVYKAAAQGIVLSALGGINGAVLAYGQTGSGKTHTMLGDRTSLGIVTMALMDVFSGMSSQERSGRLRASATLVELYNERVVDLFADEHTRQGETIAIKVRVRVVLLRCIGAQCSSSTRVHTLSTAGSYLDTQLPCHVAHVIRATKELFKCWS